MPHHTFVSIAVAVLLCFVGLSQTANLNRIQKGKAAGPYKLVDHYHPGHFFDKFQFYTLADPTGGFVQYVNQSYARQNGLIRAFDDHIEIGVDNVNYYNPYGPGRPSVRLESNKTYTHGLFILNLDRMPYACGAWPAFWTLGPDWPNHGEIDIIEGVNSNDYNLATLHTNKGCSVAGDNQLGDLVTAACDEGDSHTGCSVFAEGEKNANYGRGFNKKGGGVYAMEWTSRYIRTWHWHHHHVPKSIKWGNPNPKTFGMPQANFEGSCDFDKHFRNHSIIFDVTFCGDFAGDQYRQSQCPMAYKGYQGCLDFVGNNPSNFTDVYWNIKDLKVYQLEGDETGYLGPLPTGYSSVIPLASTATTSVSLYQPPGGGVSTSVPSHTLSVAPTHKSNNPPPRPTTHKKSSSSSTKKSSSSTKKSSVSHTTTGPSHSITGSSLLSVSLITATQTGSIVTKTRNVPKSHHKSRTATGSAVKSSHKAKSTFRTHHGITGSPSSSSDSPGPLQSLFSGIGGNNGHMKEVNEQPFDREGGRQQIDDDERHHHDHHHDKQHRKQRKDKPHHGN